MSKNIMKYILIILSLAFPLSNDIVIKSSITDSLPKNMPIIKQFFWGDKGLLRGSFIDPKSRIKELKLRKNMLELHQKVALLTLFEMMYLYYVGKKMANYDYPNETVAYDKYQNTHSKLSRITFSTYMTAAGLSILAPPGIKYSKKKFSSNKLHRYLSIVHFTGMMIQPVLGYRTANANELGLDYDKSLKAHDTVGTITMAAYFLSFLTTLF